MTVRSVDHNQVDPCLHQCLNALLGTLTYTYGSAYAQARVAVLGRARVIRFFLDIFEGDESFQLKAIIHNQQLLDAMLMQQTHDFITRGSFLDRHQPLLGCHHLAYRLVVACLKAQVTAGHDTRQAAGAGDRHARDILGAHQCQHVAYRRIRRYGNGIGNHSAFGLLYATHLISLALGSHVLMDNAESAFLRQTNSSCRLSNCIHRR
jgi:hypothetical protein